MLRSILLRIYRFAFFAFVLLHGYRAVSSLNRLLNEGKYRDVGIEKFKSFRELSIWVGNNYVWTPDTWRSLVDSISYPGKVYMSGVGDCDDIAAFNCHVVSQMKADGYVVGISDPVIMSIALLDGNTPTGHNICYFTTADDKHAHLDYNIPKYFSSLDDLVKAYVNNKRWNDGMCIGWAMTDPATLRPMKTGVS